MISDDRFLEPGRIRIRAKGSAGGHNGPADIIEKLGTEEFARLRIGIGRSDTIADVDFVLGRPGANEKKLRDEAVGEAPDAVLCWIAEGIEAAMNKFNSN